LSPKGIRLYGGNYDFYREQKEIEDRSLEQQIDAEQTALRVALKKAQEVRERQEKRTSQGERSKQKGGIARIVMNARGNLAENSSAKLREKHSNIIDNTRQRLSALRDRQLQNTELKIDFEIRYSFDNIICYKLYVFFCIYRFMRYHKSFLILVWP
jgi:ATPase subunit of ABC transporter with duplicated ATPase domains